jgi:iron complex outermembrane recepter protein
VLYFIHPAPELFCGLFFYRMMKYIHITSLLLLIFLWSSFGGFSQNTVFSGRVTDQSTGEPLPGVSIQMRSGGSGTLSGGDGSFYLNCRRAKDTLQFSHVAYSSVMVSVNCTGADTALGDIGMQASSIGLSEVRIIASYATDRATPLAFSTVRSLTIERKSGNQDYPELLKMTPGIYATREGGGTGDDRVSLRGFQQENISLLLNGVPVSSMENGLVYWSNWAGLADATEAIQVQRGLGASRVAMNSVGGTINIITRSASAQPGGVLRFSLSDYGNSRTILSLSTGKLKNGIAVTFMGSRTSGPGYVDATYVDGWAYFLSLNRAFGNKHRLVFTAMGSPERHGQRNYGMSVAEFETWGVKYNRNWGEYQGKILNLSENFYHKPQFSLNHYWTLKPGTELATSAYFSFGKGGGNYTEAYNYGTPAWDIRKDGQIDFERIYLQNQSNTDSTRLADGRMVTGYSANILTHYRADHYWAGLLSSLTTNLSDHIKLTAGVHLRSFRSHLYEVVDDLMGGSFWVEQYAWSLAGVSGREQIKLPGETINVDNYSMIQYGNTFGQLEYKNGKFSAFFASTVSGTHYRRSDPYNYPDHPLSAPVSKAGFDLKGGAGIKVKEYGNLYGNLGYYSREPYYKFVYVNFSNSIAQGLANEKIAAAEAGYSLNGPAFTARINLYYTFWKDKSMLSRENIQLADSSLTRSLIRGLKAVHQGMEAEITWKPVRGLGLSGVASLGDWRYKNDVIASVYDDNHVLADSIVVYAEGLYAGDAPQTQFGLSAEYQFARGFRLSADGLYYSRLYSSFDPVNRNNPDDRAQPYRIPDYMMFDVYAGYDFSIRRFGFSLQLACQNVLDKVTIIRGDDGASHGPDTFSGYWSMGRTYNLSARLSF